MRTQSTWKRFPWALALLWITAACSSGEKDGSKETKPQAADEVEDDGLPDGLTPEQAAKVVAKVGESTITVGDVTQRINRLSPYIRRRWSAPDKRKEFLEKLVRVELLAQEAKRLGLEDDPEVSRTVKQVMIRLMVKNDLERERMPSSVNEAELKADYEKNIDRYQRPAQIRASHIVLSDEDRAKKIITELERNSGDKRMFRQLARDFSLDEPTKERGGDLGYFSAPGASVKGEPELPAPVVEAAWKLENVGDVSPEPIRTEAGFHVVKLTNKRAEMDRPFESVKRIIENRLLREKRREAMDSFVEELRSKAEIEIFEENLAKLDIKSDGRLDPMRARPGHPAPEPPKKPAQKAAGQTEPSAEKPAR